MSSSEPQHPYLKSVATHKQIHDHPLNLSPAKMQYTFPHASRFSAQHLKPTANVPFYEVDSRLRKSTRTCSLGKGWKYDFTKNNKDVPAPNSYYPKNLSIGTNVTAKRGYTFGVSRDLAPQNGILFASRMGGLKPGPGAYTPELPKSQATVTFRIKTGRQNAENLNIGPGKYDVSSTFEPAKLIFNSRFRTTKSCKFAPLKEALQAKGADASNQGPATLQCDLKHQINPNGSFFNSKYHNSMCRSFGKAEREARAKKANPLGPGDYQMPSEFGIYVSSRVI